MFPEQFQSPAYKRPHEIFGFTKKESLFWRVNQERFDEIFDDEQTTISSHRQTTMAIFFSLQPADQVLQTG
jgi:hypothetical protein